GGGGVQLSALNPNSDDDKNCEAYKLVTKYMTKYYPEWSERYDAVLRSYDAYAAPATGSPFKETWSGNFSWNLDGTGLTDPDGYADMSAAEILADLFGDAETQPGTPVIPSQPSTPVRPSQPSQPEQPSQKGFNDVKPGDYFYDAVNWAVEKGITTGTSATTFSPNASCTRAQIVTFLWRASGSPEPKTASNPFTDVAANAYYCKAVLWAVENGITTGTSATTFSPDAPCTRAQGVTFLWRANGSKAASAAASFTDVASDAYYAPAVAWAAEQNVTSGVGNGLFSSDTTCTRAQIVSMLYCLR
ncbi:MAG: S-layer homology domain-containing protein, partial [Firmicutes bacterium]|nr:S-layer homology domain-containing protein [Bacillota bacterium]